MSYESSTENAIQQRVERSTDEGSEGQRHKTGRNETLKGPVVAAMGWAWRGDWSRIVY
jgi:hypothetical protein